jgi:hypothetical protein
MKAFAAAVVFSIVVAFGASSVLNNSYQTQSSDAFATEGARVDNPGANLIQY